MLQRTVEVGNSQSFALQLGEAGTFWMTMHMREPNRHNQMFALLPGHPRTRNKTISEQKAKLESLNILYARRSYRLLELQELARTHAVNVKII
jgi:hypothetical protein